MNGETISATPSHPFYVPKFGWTKAINLRAGDILVLSNGEYVVVEAIQHEILESPIKVYNFEVEDFHTYFVGGNCVLVHNMCVTEGTLSDNNINVSEVDPNQINFSQRTVSSNVETYTQDMMNGNWIWDDNNTIRVMERDGQLVTYDNRRLMAAQNAGLESIPVEIVKGTDSFPGKFDTWEDAFQTRFNDPRNIKAGGVVPNTGLATQPHIVYPKKG